MKSLYDILCLFILPVRAIWSSIKLFVFATYIQDQNVIHGYILILNCFHLIWKIHNSIGRNLILKYCPRITFVIIWFQIMSFLIGWRPLVTFFDNINILPLVEGVMVDYHTGGGGVGGGAEYHSLVKVYHPRRSRGWYSFSRVSRVWYFFQSQSTNGTHYVHITT